MSSTEFLVPQDTYLKYGIHIGTKFKNKYMSKFIYKTRPDGLAVLNIEKINQRIALGVGFLSQYNPEEIIVVSRRENSWKAVNAFSKATGIKVFTNRYPPGILTNPELENYTEAKMIFVTDAWPDRNAIRDAMAVGIPVMALADTNNTSNRIDYVIPCNNKGKKSLGLMFYLLAREYLKAKGTIKSDDEFKFELEEFVDE